MVTAPVDSRVPSSWPAVDAPVNSWPRRPEESESLRGDLRAGDQRLDLGPGDVGVDAPAQTAFGGADHPLAADQGREALQALSDQLGVLDGGGGVGDDAGDDHFALEIGRAHV